MTLIIAEAGVNHGGKFEEALKLVDAAKASAADAVKFQLFSSRRLWGDDRIKHLELSQPQMHDISAYCQSVCIEFMCTPFGIQELAFLRPRLKRVKIASGCIGHEDLLAAAHATGLPVILSTGMSIRAEVERAVECIGTAGNTVLHCTSSYPCRLEDVNLRAMVDMLNWLPGISIGYSDHTGGITVPIAAVALGATVIEKHLTLDRNAEGPDHKASVIPREFKAMVMAIREVEAALGDGVKRVQKSEERLRRVWHEKP